MLRSLSLIASTAFWLTMMSLLMNKEFFRLTPVQAPYELLPLHNVYVREEYQAIYLGNERIGFGFNVLENMKESAKLDLAVKQGKRPEEIQVDPDSLEVTHPYELRHQTYLSFRILGHDNELLVKGKAGLDEKLYLQNFTLKISSKDYWNELKAQVTKAGVNLTIEGKDTEPVRRIIPVQEPILYSEALDFIWTPQNLRSGKRGRFSVWNPLLAQVESVNFYVDKKETIQYDGEDTAAYTVHFQRKGVEYRSWVSPEGVTLRKEGSTGLFMQKEESWKIFDAMREKRSAPPDLPNLFSVPTNRVLENPESLRYLKLNVKSPAQEKFMEIKREDFEDLEAIPFPLPNLDPSLDPYLASDELIQSNDPAIQEQARAIVGLEKSVLNAGLKIMNWVHQTIAPAPTISLPSAKQILVTRKGDCNEYTALFTALARSLGIPTKMIAGLVYQNGRFFYHAWPAVYLGRWVALDPTFGEAPVNVTHIPLVEGDLKEQMALVENLGQLKIVILEAR